MAPDPADSTLEGLKSLVQTTAALISKFETLLHNIAVHDNDRTSNTAQPPSSSDTSSSLPSDPRSIDALALAHDASSLIRAHTTKLSLLIINEPFTPSAINKVLRELVAGPIPGLASAVQVCDAERYTNVARQDLAWRCYRLLKELRGLVETIPLDGKALSNTRKNGTGGDKGSLASTGVIWAACDDVILLKKLGIAGLLVKKVEDYRDTLKDVLEELKEWSEEVDEDDSDDDDDDDDESDAHEDDQTHDAADAATNSHISTQAMLDDLMNPQHIPRDDPDKIRERLDSCLKRLRLTTLLYSAVVKRRLKTLPPLPPASESTVPQRLDEVLPILKRLPHRFGEVACSFYELDPAAIDKSMDSCFFDAFAACEMLVKPWEGQRDEFTDWADKFQVSIKKPE
ncbi:hypothetical protein F4780DRAFT_778261 [Xylariomycetidae sp. FL0641]|nr:hypothetical protein F4780DRAFT_778261 [Xylariomycetidae sp. FL0641]